jgi:hypothetical protein
MRGPQICPVCRQTIEPGGDNVIAMPTGYPEGRPTPPTPAFHRSCFDAQVVRGGRSFDLCVTCGGIGVQEADEVGRQGEHECLDCAGAGYVIRGIPAS